MLLDLRGERLPIGALAREVGISQHHFIRQFAALFGATPHQLRIDARLAAAEELLADPQRSVTEVCFALGFASLGSFSASFARRRGGPPSQRRRRGFVSVPPPMAIPGCFGLMCAVG